MPPTTTATLVSTLVTESPTKAHLMALRFAERARLHDFKRRLADMDPERHGRAMAAMEQVAQACADRLAEIEAKLSDKPTNLPITRHAEINCSNHNNSDGGDVTTTAEAQHALRQRLQHLALVIDRHAPASCASAAANLQRAITTELRRLEHEQRGRS